MSVALDHRWISWVEENIQRGCNPEELLDILLKNNFSVTSIRNAMGEKFPAGSTLLPREQAATGPLRWVTPGVDHKRLSEIRITKLGKEAGVTRVDTPHLQLYTYDDFLGDRECDLLIELARSKLRPSTITTEDTEPDKYFRTSSTCDLLTTNHSIVKEIDEKIGLAMGINPSYSESIQAQRYDIGQEFKAHTDFFEPGTKEFERFGSKNGNRTWTFMIYLKKALQGGGTNFNKLDMTFFGKRGQAIIWNNLNPDGTPNRYSVHHATPVEKGEKIVITKWFRELGGTGDMFL